MLLLAVLPCFFAVGVFAEEKVESLPQEYTAVVEGLPSELEDTLPEGIFSTDAEVFGDAVAEMSSLPALLNTGREADQLCWRLAAEQQALKMRHVP